MLVLFVQFGARRNEGGLLAPVLFVAGTAVVGGLLLPVIRVVVTRARSAWRERVARRRRARSRAGAELRARAHMSELCPYGWRAQVTLYAQGAVGDDGDPVSAPVALDWHELRPDGRPAVARRVWADSVAEALDAMVADRRTDEALEQIELRASADGAHWPEH